MPFVKYGQLESMSNSTLSKLIPSRISLQSSAQARRNLQDMEGSDLQKTQFRIPFMEAQKKNMQAAMAMASSGAETVKGMEGDSQYLAN
jgi:hypothetical protein